MVLVLARCLVSSTSHWLPNGFLPLLSLVRTLVGGVVAVFRPSTTVTLPSNFRRLCLAGLIKRQRMDDLMISVAANMSEKRT